MRQKIIFRPMSIAPSLPEDEFDLTPQIQLI